MEDDYGFYETDFEDVEEMEFTSVRFIDAMRLAKNTWDDGHHFDVHPGIMEDAVPMAPVKILSRSLRASKKGERKVYIIWAAVKMRNTAYDVPVRLFVYADEFDELAFKWRVSEPRSKININAYIESIENDEEQNWTDLLESGS